jgi:hypothetical protein
MLTGVLLLGSGAVKVRAGSRIALPTQLLSIVELLMGVLAWVLAAAGASAAPLARWIVPLGVVLVVVSSLRFLNRHRALSDRRAATEARRLEAFLRGVLGGKSPPPP